MSDAASPSSLAATRVSAVDTPTRQLVMLHGIYGRGRNWQAIARALTAERPEYACWLVDMPYHGDSGPGAHGDTVSGLAADVEDWRRAEGLTVDAILGHSYGGKVALAWAALASDAPQQVWIVDSTPAVKSASGSAWSMLEIVRRLPQRFATRGDLVSAIVSGGFPVGVAQWMATNLTRDGDELVWRLDFDAMERLLHDFFTTDLWPVVDRSASGASPVDLHFLKASESSALADDAVRRLEAASGPRVHLHHRPGGHWIHAESPEVVTALLVEHLP